MGGKASDASAAIIRRRNFKELASKSNQRFEYSALPEYPLLFSNAVIGSIQSVILMNQESKELEQIAFRVSHNSFFPESKRRQIYGMVEVDGDYYVQIEFNIMEAYFDYDSSYNRIVAYLRTPPVYHLSPRE